MSGRYQGKYTLVRHSAWMVTQNPQFYRAVETASVNTAREERRILAAGGVVFESYIEASDQEERENYPPEVQGICPLARGGFSKKLHDGAHIYIPHTKGLVRKEELSGV